MRTSSGGLEVADIFRQHGPAYRESHRLAKKLCPEVPFILVTGALSGDNRLCREILANGAKEYVLKDQLEQLAPAIRKALGAINYDGNSEVKRVS